ncbi:MAG: hypothetical protein BMS9Abin07_2362 [Acidimicrobiia bacterium]|nr:MAG: hypothetical protein BMS9Abin07_2362 [Acidimicrobiia bacterium]
MTARRPVILGTLVVAAMALSTVPALADGLTEYLEEADQAVYSGRQLVVTTWDGVQATDVVEVRHFGGMAMVGSGPAYTMIGQGRVNAVGVPGAAIAYVPRAQAPVTHAYELAGGERSTRFGRTAKTIEVVENGVLRMRMLIDTETAAPLETEVFDADGNLYRRSTMVEFSASAAGMEDYEDDGEYETMLPLDEVGVPDGAGRYRLIDAYGTRTAVEHGFYTDGLFRFSLFAIDGRTDVSKIAREGQTWDVGGFEYVRVITPAEVWVLWNAPDQTFALVGDLPPDHLKEVMADLPRPGQRNWFVRAWRRLFG